MATMNVLDSAGATVAVEKPLAPGQAAMAASRPVVLASDQSSIPVAATLAAETTKVIGTVRTASGGIAAGSLAAGAGVDGWDLTQGAIADAAVTAGATGSVSAKLRSISRDIGSLVTAIGSTAWDLGAGAIGSRTQRIALASDSAGVIATAAPGTLSAAGPSVTAVNPSQYETVAASQTAQPLGATGATGDFINGLLVIPATTSPGNVLLLDNATSITVFTGGATSVSNLVPFFIPLGMTSVSGAWKVTTGANVSAIGIGKFT